MAVFARPFHNVQRLVLLDQDVMVRHRRVDRAGAKALPVARFLRRKRPGAAEDLRQERGHLGADVEHDHDRRGEVVRQRLRQLRERFDSAGRGADHYDSVRH